MARLAPSIKLLRSLARAAKANQRLTLKLLAGSTPPRKRPPRTARPPPALPPLTGQWLTGSLAPIDYWLYLPRTVPDNVTQRGWPLVVMLHGCHQSAPEFAEGTRMNRLADAKGYAVLYPQQTLSAHPHRCWRWYDRATQEGGGDTALLAALIEQVIKRFPIDRCRIYACGLSAGAGMAAVLALNHPELIAAIGQHSGPVFGAGHSQMGALHVMRHGAPLGADAAIGNLLERRSALAVDGGQILPMPPMPPMPAILIQGALDQVVHPVNQEHLARQWLQLNGLPAGPATKVTVKPAGRSGGRSTNALELHDYLVGRKLMLRVARIAGLGHAWSGGDASLKFNAGAGPDASRMVLAFFGRHRRQA